MYVAISGNIGSGKSTLTGLMSERYALRPVFEAVDENPYLRDFYADMTRWAFHSQVFFLGRRIEQHLTQVNAAERVIQDRTVYEDAQVFARNLRLSGNMDDRDWQTYLALYEAVQPALRAPGLLVYLQCSVETLERRIAGRGRAYEQGIPRDYLE
ncbi:MAG TPA: deoxynucleoside kinase, partial [Deinococcales bacterium]|nr:deoxynucleoside kinase [Deinococcales bacterium]